jgi:hypothetical protein
MSEDLLEPGQGESRLDPVDAERVAEIMDSHIVELGRLAALSEHLLRLTVGERMGKDGVSRAPGISHPVGGEELDQRVGQGHVASGAGCLRILLISTLSPRILHT